MKRFLIVLALMMVGITLGARPVMAADDYTGADADVSEGSCAVDADGNVKTFLWMRPWYYGLECSNGSIASSNFEGEAALTASIRAIILTIIYDISVIIGILAAGFLIYGGFQYTYARGDAGAFAKGKRTITAASVGLIISVVANIAINTVSKVLIGSSTAGVAGLTGTYNLYDIKPENMLSSVVSFVLALAAVVAVGFIIYAGIVMTTSYGDSAKIAKARKSILYAISGLIVVVAAFGLVNFVTGGLNTAISESADKNLFEVTNNVFGLLVAVVGLLSVIGVVIGGIQYMTAAGDSSKVQKGKQTLTYSLIGLGVTLLAGAIISFVINRVFNS